MNKTPKNIVWDLVEHYLNKGMTDKDEIYRKISGCTGMPLPTIRRIIRDLKNNMIEKAKILGQVEGKK